MYRWTDATSATLAPVEPQAGGPANRQTGGPADRQTGGLADRQTGGPADRQTGGLVAETHALWPVFSASETRDVSHTGLHPLWSFTTNRGTGSSHLDFLWPVASRRVAREAGGTNRSWFVLPLWFSSRREADDGSEASWKTLFPLYYAAAKSAPGTTAQSYLILFPIWWRMNHHHVLFPFYWSEPDRSFAFFPFYGVFHDLFEINTIRFVLWPLWVTSERGAVRSYSAPWPFLGVTTGGGARGGRLWPLAGYVHNPREGDRGFWLWPLGQYVTFARGPYKGATLNMFLPLWLKVDHPKRHIAYYFPFYGESRSDRRVSRAYLWPLFSRTVSEAPSYEKWNFLWFVLSRQKGPEEQRRFYLLNLIGWTDVPGRSVRAHVFWPVLQYRYDHPADKDPEFERHYALPFWYSWTKRWEDGRRDYHRTLWPLASWERQGSDRSFRALQLIPCNASDGIGRNWAPLWTLYSSSGNSETGARERRVLGPLYLTRQDRWRDESEVNLLFFQYSRSRGARKISLLFGFLPFQISGKQD